MTPYQTSYDFVLLSLSSPAHSCKYQFTQSVIIAAYETIDFPILKKLLLYRGSDAVFSFSSLFYSRLLDAVLPERMSEEEKNELRYLNMAFNCSILGLLWTMSEQKDLTFSPMIGNVILSMMPQKLDMFWKENQSKVADYFKANYPDIYELAIINDT